MRVGPRGWAALTLAGGSVLALPFLRATQTPTPTHVDSSVAASDQEALGDDGIASFHAAANHSVMSKRRVVGSLPSTRELAPASDLESFAVPDWARPESRLDELITSEASSLPTPKMENLPSTSVAAMRPWTPGDESVSRAQPLRGNEPRYADSVSQLSMRPVLPTTPVLPPKIEQPRQSALVDVASSTRDPDLVVQTSAMTALPDYGNAATNTPGRPEPQGEAAARLPLPAPVLRRRDRLANPPREKNFVYQPGIPRE